MHPAESERSDMQIAIKLDKDIIENLNDGVGLTDYQYKSLIDAITNGTPLPKGHKRLIEDNFEVGPVYDEEGNRVSYRYVTQAELNSASTIVEADNEEKECEDKV